MRLDEIPTPAIILDRTRLLANLARMRARAAELGVALRPHLKTAKSVEIARLATAGQPGGITVSTLAEAEYFLRSGFRDITYAVGIVPAKLERVARLQAAGARLTLITDNLASAAAIVAHAKALGARFRVLIEIDVGEGRAGVAPDGDELLAIAAALHQPAQVELAGVLAHAGHSYRCEAVADLVAVAEDERSGAVRAADRLRAAGYPCATVSVGSTPTALFAARLDGVTEMRPGNYVFFDLFQAGLGTCSIDDIAVSVLASVTGHHLARNHLLLDAGALALSKDVGANRRRPGTGYGLICHPATRRPEPGLAVLDVHQEHGIVGQAGGLAAAEKLAFDRYPVGSRLLVLPNHACMTAAMYDCYYVHDDGAEIVAEWDRVNGW